MMYIRTFMPSETITGNVPRPQVDHELAERARELHIETHGHEPGSLQEAFATAVQQATTQSESWYPGKFIREGLGMVTDQYNQEGSEIPAQQESAAVFKSRLDKNGQLTVPEGERDILGVTPGTAFQVVAYPINLDTDP